MQRVNKKNQKIFFSIFILANFCFVQKIFAAPRLDSISGTVSEGQDVNIAGTGFGVKFPVAPILWETFEDGVVGSALPTTGKWLARTGVGGYFNADDKYGGSKSAYASMYNCQNTDCSLNTSHFPISPTDKVYYSYYTKYKNTGGDDYGVFKNGRITTTESELFYNKGGVMALSDGAGYAEKDSITTDLALKNAFNPDPFYGEQVSPYRKGTKFFGLNWQRHEMYRKLSNPAGASNGKAWINIDNADSNVLWAGRSHNISNVVTRVAGQTWQQSDVLLGLMFENAHADQLNEIWIDDVYIDNTEARVELCDSATWTARTHCEPQIPKTTWNDTELNININQGSFADGSTAYLYVVDENGTENTVGYPINLNGVIDTTAPSAPSGLFVQ